MDKVALPDDIESLVDHMLQHYLSDMLRDSYCNERWHERNWREARAKIIKMAEQSNLKLGG